MKRNLRSIVLMLVTVAGLFPTAVFLYACIVPVDISGSPEGKFLPAAIVELKERDDVAYPAHLLLGRALEGARCNPVAVGYQLIKAGAHANTGSEVKNAGDILALARRRSRSQSTFDEQVCAVLGSAFARTQQKDVARLGGTSCPGAGPPVSP